MSLNKIVKNAFLSIMFAANVAYADNTKVPEGGANWGQQDKKEQTCPTCDKGQTKQVIQSKKPIKKQIKKGIRCKEAPLPGRNIEFLLNGRQVNGENYICLSNKQALAQGYDLKDQIRGNIYTNNICKRCRSDEYAYLTHKAYCRDQAKLKTAQSAKARNNVLYTGSYNSENKACDFSGSCAQLRGGYRLVKKGGKEKCEKVIAHVETRPATQPTTLPTTQPTIQLTEKPIELQSYISAKTGTSGSYFSFGVDHSAVKIKGTGPNGALTTIYPNQFTFNAIKEFNIALGRGWNLSPQLRLEYNGINGSQRMEGHQFWLGGGLGLSQATLNQTGNTQFEFVGYAQTLASQASRTIISLPDNLGTIHSTSSYTDAWRAGGEFRLLIDSKLALELFGEIGRQGQNQFTTLNGAPLSEGATTRNNLQYSNLELAAQYRADALLNPTANFSWRQDRYTLEDGSGKAYDNFSLKLGNEFTFSDRAFRLKPTFIRSTQTGQFGVGLEACVGKNRQFCFEAEYTPSESTDRINQILPIFKGGVKGSF